MKAAYVDTSCIVGLALVESISKSVSERLATFRELVSSNLLEAELRSAMTRENAPVDPGGLIAGISWIYPDRPLTPEFEKVLGAGYIRGADLWHLAVALWIDPRREIAFLTLDARQREIAKKLGFPV